MKSDRYARRRSGSAIFTHVVKSALRNGGQGLSNARLLTYDGGKINLAVGLGRNK
jgi:hypothetical protein